MTSRETFRLVFVGGHHNPALAVIDALKERSVVSNFNFQIYWFGHKYSLWGDRSPSAEYREVTAQGFPFFDLKAGKFFRTFHPLKLARLPFGFVQAFYFLVRVRPHLIVSFGGYLAVPVAFAGWLLHIPVLTHEQTLSPGLANRFIAFWAKEIFVAWPETIEYFPKAKVVVTGNPLRPYLFSVKQPLIFPGERDQLPTIYVTGGKQGSHSLNRALKGILPDLLREFNVIHQCGRTSLFTDYEDFEVIREALPNDLREGYLLKDYFGEREIGSVFARASFLISRSGANIVYELAALGKPALLIPIPWSSGGEQEKNARKAKDLGLAEIIPQDKLTPQNLLQAIRKMKDHLGQYRLAAPFARTSVVLDAADRVAAEIENFLMVK